MKKLYTTILFAFVGLGIQQANAQYTKLLDFAGAANGSRPYGSLITDGTFLYGMTSQGGTNSGGTLFKIKPDGTNYADLLDFAGANGQYPYGSLISDGTFLHGMIYQGGTNVYGSVFKIKPDGTGYLKLLDFAGFTNGSNPHGDLYSDGTFLYGMTQGGGTNSDGTIFKIKPDGSGYVKLLDFAGANGQYPKGSLITDGTFLYGMTINGGANSDGTIFKIMPDGTGYTKLLDFAGATNGSYPYGSLISDGTFLYGMTYNGGTNGDGTIFKIMPDGTSYTKLLDFAGANGQYPYGSLISDGTFLYGMTYKGGTNGYGTIFKIMPDGSGYADLLDFAGANGQYPKGSLISDGTFLYGMTYDGGTNGWGVVFKLCIPPMITANVSATSVCAGASVTLMGGGANTYSWSGGVSDGVAFIPPTGTITYTVTGTITLSGCSNTATKTITVNPLPTVTPVATATTVCTGDSVILSVSGNADTYTWSGGITNGVAFVPPVGITTYTVTGTNTTTGCQNTTTKIITVNQLPVVTATPVSQTICSGGATSIALTSNETGTTYVGTVTQTNVSGGVSLTGSTIAQTLTTTGINPGTAIYVVTPTATNCVGAPVSVTITVNTVDNSVTQNNNILTANANGATYQWLNCNNGFLPITGSTNQSYTATSNGNYAVIVTQNGCSDTSSCYNVSSTGIASSFSDSGIIIYPNPGNGKVNVLISQFENVQMKIYNVLGECVHQQISTSSNFQIDLSKEPKGIYFINIHSENNSIIANKKLIIQ